jgi:expansin (peptidoglycan-binding protein)
MKQYHQMRSALPLALAGIFFFLQPEPVDAQCPPVPIIHTGEATFYTFASGAGSCMFDSTPHDLMVGAMNDVDYDNSQVCGECIRITGPNGIILIRIVDRCPGCAEGDIDLSPLAFSLIADTSLGRVPISWQVISCGSTGPIQYHFKDGSNQWWTAVQIRNHINPILSLEYLDSHGTYRSVNRVEFNYFIETAGMGPGPYTFRVTDIYGHTLIDSGIPHSENSSVPGHAQFPPCTLASTNENEGPAVFYLSQNFPNPFNPATTFTFGLSEQSDVRLDVLTTLGQSVAVLVNETRQAGYYSVKFDASNLASGLYFYRLQAGAFVQTKKLLLLK